jgi:ADP-heptose:LPS heptosyltransferase
VEKFLIINPFGIGDCLFTTPVIRALKESRPGCFIGYWCNERVAGLLNGQPGIDRVFALSRGDIKRIYRGFRRIAVLGALIKEIRRERFDTAIDFSLDGRYGLWSRLAGIKRRIGFDYKGRGRFLTHRVPLTGYSGTHAIEHYAGLLKFIGIDPQDRRLRLEINKESAVPAGAIGIAMGGGASWGRDAVYKQWPAGKFRELVGVLVKNDGTKVVLLGSLDEKALAGVIAQEGVTDLTGKLGLPELAAAIKRLKLLICNDGGPMHMAVALGVSTVSVFGPVDEKEYGPYPPDKRHIVVGKDLSCRPCYKNFRFPGCSNERRCLEDITVDEVYRKVKELL